MKENATGMRDTLRVERGSILEPIRAIEVRPFFEK